MASNLALSLCAFLSLTSRVTLGAPVGDGGNVGPLGDSMVSLHLNPNLVNDGLPDVTHVTDVTDVEIDSPSNTTEVAGSVVLPLRTLLVGNDDSLQVPRIVLEGYSTPFDTAAKVPSLSSPKYNAIVVTTDSLRADEWARLRAYGARYNVRIAYLKSQPINVPGLKAASRGGTNVVFDSSDKGQQLADVLNPGGAWPVPGALEPQPATVGTATGDLTVFMRFTSGSNPTAGGPVAAVTARADAGGEEMHFFFNAAANEICDDCNAPNTRDLPNSDLNGEYTYLNMALVNVWFQWATRGVYLGQRRQFLEMQLDDYFLDTTLYSTGKNFRLSGQDTRLAAEWSRSVSDRHNLPEGSRVRLELGFNGAGHSAQDLEKSGLGKGLNDATTQYLEDFDWVSHTWSHQNLDWLTAEDCKQGKWKCPTSRKTIDAEIRLNRKFADGEAVVSDPSLSPPYSNFQNTPGGFMFGPRPDLKNKIFSANSLITPEISGLRPFDYDFNLWGNEGAKPRPGNTDAIKSFLANGIVTVVGDNSRAELVSKESLHHGIMTTVASHGASGVLIIPRWAVNMAYKVHTASLYTQFYNDNNVCFWASGPPCKSGKKYTFGQAMKREATWPLYALLGYRADPYMFHQANMHFFAYQGKQISLITYWADLVIEQLQRYVTGLPLTSPRMDEVGEYFRQRMSRDSCNLGGSVTYRGGKMVELNIQGGRKCTAVLSVNGRVDGIRAKPKSTGQLSNGPDTIYEIPVDSRKSVKVPLSQ